MNRRLLPRIVVGGLLVASFIAWATNDLSPSAVSGPDLYSIYKQTHSQNISTIKTAKAYIDALVSQQQMNILQQRLSFYQNELKTAKSKAGLFSHVSPEVESQLDDDINLAQAAYFGAKMEWKSNLQALNAVTQQYYEGVKPLDENFVIVVPKVDKKTKMAIQAAQKLQQQLKVVHAQKKALDGELYSYSRGYIKIQPVVAQGIKYYQAQEKFWNLASSYMKQTIDLNTYQKQLSQGMIQRFNQTLYQPQQAKQWLYAEHKTDSHKMTKHRKRRHEEYVKQHAVSSSIRKPVAITHYNPIAAKKTPKKVSPLVKIKTVPLAKQKTKSVELKPLAEPKVAKVKAVKQKPALAKLPQPKTERLKHHSVSRHHHAAKKIRKVSAHLSKAKTSPLLRQETALVVLKPLVEPKAVKHHRQLVKLPQPMAKLDVLPQPKAESVRHHPAKALIVAKHRHKPIAHVSKAKTSPLLRQEVASAEIKLAHISKPKRHVIVAHQADVHHQKRHKQHAPEKFYILPEPNSTRLKFVI